MPDDIPKFNLEETQLAPETPDLSAVESDAKVHELEDIPQRIDRYEIRGVLGKGGFGTVFRAWDPRLEREVALKLPHRRHLDSPSARERFLREARAVAGLHHPSICPVHEVHELEDGRCLISLAYIDGKPLSSFLEQGKPFKQTDAAKIIQQVALALHSAHERGVIHRDIKPANILMTKQRRPIVTDFGLARRESKDETLTLEGDILGTPAYMSPEQALGQHDRVTAASDVYSLGATFYEMLTATRPFTGSTVAVLAKVIRDIPPSPSTLRPKIKSELADVVMRALEKNPADRYSSMLEFAQAVRDAMKSPQDPDTLATPSASREGELSEFPSISPVREPVSRPRRKKAKNEKSTRRQALLYLVGTIVLLGLFSIGVAVWKPWQNTATLPTERRELANSSSTADVPGTALSKELSGPESKSPLIGKWRLYSGFLPRGGEAEIEFSPDGTVRIGQDGNEIEGTSDASSIQLRFASLPEMENVTVTPARQTVDVFVEPAGDNNFIQPPYTVFSFRPHERWTLSIFDSQHLYGRRAHSSAWDQQDAPSGAVAEIQIEEIALFHESSEPGPPFLNYPGEQLIGVWETGGLSAQRESVQFEFNRSGDFFTTIDGQRFGGRSGEGNVQQTYRVTTSDDPAKYGWTIFSRKPNEQAERVTLVDDVTFQSKERWEIDLMQLTGARNPPQVAFTRYEINYVSKEIPYDVNVVVDGETRKERRVRAFYQYVPVTKTFAASKVFY